jgi:hypothetical protein
MLFMAGSSFDGCSLIWLEHSTVALPGEQISASRPGGALANAARKLTRLARLRAVGRRALLAPACKAEPRATAEPRGGDCSAGPTGSPRRLGPRVCRAGSATRSRQDVCQCRFAGPVRVGCVRRRGGGTGARACRRPLAQRARLRRAPGRAWPHISQPCVSQPCVPGAGAAA